MSVARTISERRFLTRCSITWKHPFFRRFAQAWWRSRQKGPVTNSWYLRKKGKSYEWYTEVILVRAANVSGWLRIWTVVPEGKTIWNKSCGLSPWLFNNYIEEVLSEVYIRTHGWRVNKIDKDPRYWVVTHFLFLDVERSGWVS